MIRSFVLSLAFLLAAAGPAFCQKSLRWKLRPGDELQVHISQQTSSTVAVAGKPIKSSLEMTLETLWKVDAADEQSIKMTQSVQRIEVQLVSGELAPIVYDSAAKSTPIGPAKDLAAAVKPLLAEGSALIVTMNPRGEILEVAPSAKLAELWKVPTGKDSPKDSAGAQAGKTTQELLKRTLVLLPEKPVSATDAGKEKWSSQRDVQIPIGSVKQTMEFVYAGEAEVADQKVAGEKLERIDFTSQLTLAPAATRGPKLTIKDQSQTGHALFAAEQGRVVHAEQTQKMVTEAPYRDTVITVTVESTVKTDIRPQEKK